MKNALACCLGLLGLACGATAAPAVGGGAVATPASASADPCAHESGLVLEAPISIPSRWDGEGSIVAGQAPLTMRWCGERTASIVSLTIEGDGGGTWQREFDPSAAPLDHGGALTYPIDGRAQPGALHLRVIARASDGAMIEASADTRSEEDPTLARARTDCDAAHGVLGPVGLAGSIRCTRPTLDGGRRCLSSSDCEGLCLEDHLEDITNAPDGRTCAVGEHLRLHVGRCDTQTPRFGCTSRLDEVTSECIGPGLRGRSVVCAD
jgi:hypothetical protein